MVRRLTREGRAWRRPAFDATLATDGYTVDGHPAGAIAMRICSRIFRRRRCAPRSRLRRNDRAITRAAIAQIKN